MTCRSRCLAPAIGLLCLFATAASAGTAKQPVARIAVLVSSDKNGCYDPGVVRAIRRFTAARADEINAAGGAGGRHLELDILDDFEDTSATTDNVRQALAGRDLVAMVGLSSSTRAKAMFAEIGPQLKESGVPFLSDISLDQLFTDYPNVFSMTNTAVNEIEVAKRFAADHGFKAVAFAGIDGDDYSMALGDGLAAGTVDRRFTVTDNRLADADIAAFADEIALKKPDLLYLAGQSGPDGQILKALAARGLNLPSFVLLGRASRIVGFLPGKRPLQDIFEIARDGVPDVLSERMQQRIVASPREEWVFDDLPNKLASGWKSGACVAAPDAAPLRITDEKNRRAIARGTQFADMIGAISEAMQGLPPERSVPDIRQHIVEAITGMSGGKAMYRGLWQDWTFTANRTSADDTLITVWPSGATKAMLAPRQYHRTGTGIEPIPVIYLSLDLTGIGNIDAASQSFEGEFYLSLKSEDPGLTIANIDFTNAFRSPANRDALLAWRELDQKSLGTALPEGVKLYKVSGKFGFEPAMANFPFDKQRLTIAFQPAASSRPFLIQPTSTVALQSLPKIDGFKYLNAYVGSDQDAIPTLDGTGGKAVVSFYKFNDTFVVKRLSLDYAMRVILPLGFILLMTYFSAFMARERFDSIIAVQVTALLSAIALNFSLPPTGADGMTLSDTTFIVAYAAISLMIGLSVLKDSRLIDAMTGTDWIVSGIQKVVFPLAMLGLLGWLLWFGITN